MADITVHIGEVKIARHGETLMAILGSCVGIGIIWREKQLCGLAHCLLPESPVKTFEIGGRFVTQAIPSLLALMKIHQRDFASIETVVAGGGNMTYSPARKANSLVGATNLETAEREFKKLGLRKTRFHAGGDAGSRIIIDAQTFSYRIENIPRMA